MKVYPPCESCGAAVSDSNRPTPAGMVRYGGRGLCDTCAHRRRREAAPHAVPLPTPAAFDARPWVESALCAQTGAGDFWFPEKGDSSRRAKSVCSDCPVRVECLDYAVSNEEAFGVWGGLSPRERFRLRRGAA